jgi:MoaA/NifB/PqqE/SkfB family radical SAM enzyme
MDLQPITQMLTLSDIKVLHLEPTDACQAACPLCARETDAEFDKSSVHHLSMYDIITALGVDCISKLDKMFMCGNYGDPAAGKHTLNIYRSFRQINPNITLGMNTNGGLRKPEFWKELANILNRTKDYVVFSIDGLEDTNHIYRKNVDWKKLQANVTEFIAAGGKAHWDMLVYKHNQHQVSECERQAKDMGFTWFRTKVSKRPYINGLEFPVNWKNPVKQQGDIVCQALKDSSAYMDARKNVHPCCWLGSRLSNFVTLEQVKETWASNPHPVCREICSGTDNSFTNQWQREVQLC